MPSLVRSLPLRWQFVVCVAAVLVVAMVCFLAEGVIGYRVAALVLLMAVSLLAMLFEIGPVVLASALSAVVWNFFFIPPVFTFHIGSAEDLLMFLLYFVIALVNAVLTLKIRKAERIARDREEKEKSIKLYNTLLSSLSHELRTPIATIMGAVDALEEDGNKLSMEHRRELLREVGSASVRLDRQVGDLLNMGRLESGMLEPKRDWCDVNETIGHVVRSMNEPRSHSIYFAPEGALPLFKLDGGLLAQVVYNLLSNAVQYTPAGSLITIRARCTDDALVLTVADNGPGIPEEERQRVFDKFYRARHVRSGGSGLGLSIVKGFVEAQGGSVILGANSPKGAIFTVVIPAETSFLSNLKNE